MSGCDVSMITPSGICQSEQINALEFQKTSKLACSRPSSIFTKGGEVGEIGRVLFAFVFDKTSNWVCAWKW